jgi:hypothetical protein
MMQVFGKAWKETRCIKTKQEKSIYSFMKDHNFKMNLKSIKIKLKGDVKTSLGGKGGGGDGSKNFFHEENHTWQQGGGEKANKHGF